jgi:Amt family ammonium transporter
MSFGNLQDGSSDIAGLFVNPFHLFGLNGVIGDDGSRLIDVFGVDVFIPETVFVGFQLTFAVITVALISGAVADRVKFSTWLVFSGIWATIVYFPISHMVWGGGILSGAEGGLSAKIFGATDGVANVLPIDFAGGTVVHINAGIAGLVLALIVGKRLGFGTQAMRPHNVPVVMLGAGLLWFGWFGFNAGSELAADGLASTVWLNTTAATCAAMLGWLLVEKLRDGHATSIGGASGVVAGLVAITPACGALSPLGSLILGVVAGGLSALAVGLKYRFGYDDSLDVVGVHMVGGIVGSLSIGFLATGGVGQTAKGLFYGGGLHQLGLQFIGVGAVLGYSVVVSAVLAKAIDLVMGFRVTEDEEISGVDRVLHAETAYDFAGVVGAARNAPTGTGSQAGDPVKKVDA